MCFFFFHIVLICVCSTNNVKWWTVTPRLPFAGRREHRDEDQAAAVPRSPQQRPALHGAERREGLPAFRWVLLGPNTSQTCGSRVGAKAANLIFLLIAEEEEITFPPTYRFERDTRDKYAYTKAKATGVRMATLFLLSCTGNDWAVITITAFGTQMSEVNLFESQNGNMKRHP